MQSTSVLPVCSYPSSVFLVNLISIHSFITLTREALDLNSPLQPPRQLELQVCATVPGLISALIS